LHAIKSKQRARKIGLLAQDTEFAFPGTVFETALLGRYPYASNWLRDSTADIGCVNQALAAVQLTALQNRFVTTLSGGEKRRLALAMLLAQDPDIYLLDEPTNHLDIQQKVRVLSLLHQLAKQQHKIIIMVLHDINLMRAFCDKIILFGAKANYFAGECADILCSAKLQSIFSVETLQVYE
jgi:iron complex transport system ATP-binding protein